jgi:hypothetical protein
MLKQNSYAVYEIQLIFSSLTVLIPKLVDLQWILKVAVGSSDLFVNAMSWIIGSIILLEPLSTESCKKKIA